MEEEKRSCFEEAFYAYTSIVYDYRNAISSASRLRNQLAVSEELIEVGKMAMDAAFTELSRYLTPEAIADLMPLQVPG